MAHVALICAGDGIDNLPGARQAFAHIWRWAACPRWPCAAPNSAWAALRRGAVLAASLTLLYYPRHAVGQVCQVAEEEEALQAEGGHDLPVRRRREDPGPRATSLDTVQVSGWSSFWAGLTQISGASSHPTKRAVE